MNKKKFLCLGVALMLAYGAAAQEPEQAQELSEAQRIYGSLQWSAGPGTFEVTPQASITLPEATRVEPPQRSQGSSLRTC